MKRRISVVATALALLVAACGGSGESGGVASLEDTTPTTSGPESAEPTQEEALLAFAQCVRDQGIDMPDPTVDENGNVRLVRPGGEAGAEPGSEFDRQAFETAIGACDEYLVSVTMGFDRRDTTEFQDHLYRYAQCMRDNGYDMPDPVFTESGEPGSGGGPGGGVFGALDRDDPTFQAAQEVCRQYLPGFGGGGMFGGRPPGGPDE